MSSRRCSNGKSTVMSKIFTDGRKMEHHSTLSLYLSIFSTLITIKMRKVHFPIISHQFISQRRRRPEGSFLCTERTFSHIYSVPHIFFEEEAFNVYITSKKEGERRRGPVSKELNVKLCVKLISFFLLPFELSFRLFLLLLFDSILH